MIVEEPVVIRRPLLRYMGSKFRFRWLADLLESIEHDTYCAAFGGSAGDMLGRRTPAPVECYNDLDGGLANLFRVLRDRRDQRELLRRLRWTEYGQPVQREAIQILRRADVGDPDLDAVEWAWGVYVRSWTGVMGTLQRYQQFGYSRIRDRSYNPVSMRGAIRYLPTIVERLQHLQVFCEDWRKFVGRFDRYPRVLVYLDPPYPRSTRHRPSETRKDYHLDVDNQPRFDGMAPGPRDLHAEIADYARTAHAAVAISTYPCAWAEGLATLDGWAEYRRAVRSGAGLRGRVHRVEVVLLNPVAVGRMGSTGAREHGTRQPLTGGE